MKALLITAGSLLLTAGVLANAFVQKKQFYPSVVYITKSSPSMAVLYLQAFVFVVLFGKLLRKLFFGQLRAAELEHLIERSWYAVTETCLAFTVFRDDFSPKFVALFTLLLFLKCFHWLAEDRVDYMERSPIISIVFHFRVLALTTSLAMVDVYFIHHAYYSTLMKGASVQLVFGFEYAILLTAVLHIFVKYVLHTVDLQSENPWENKTVFLLYTELLLGFVKVVLYMLFLFIMIKVHTFPLFAIRPMYLTIRAFKKALNDVIMSRRAIRNMNTRYPDATAEELSSGDNVCIICREEMATGCKKLPCNHIFHTSCLRSWFQRQQTCPTCRMDVLRPLPSPVRPPQQPPPQQPPAAPQQPQPFGPFPGFPGFPMWPQPEAPVAPPPAVTSAGATQTPAAGSATTGATPGVTPQGAATATPGSPAAMPPFMMPPFFMPMPFPSPPVLPTPDHAGLTAEELQAMEGQERQNVEARLQCLRNIQVLLDAAMVQMQQYTSVIQALSFNTAQAPGAGSAAPAAAATAPLAPSSVPASLVTATSTTPSVTSPISSPGKPASPAPPATALPSHTKATNPAAKADSDSSTSPNAAAKTDELTDLSSLEGAVGYTPSSPEGAEGYTPATDELIPEYDQDEDPDDIRELRRRRLQKFSETQSSRSENCSSDRASSQPDHLDLD